MGLIPSYITTRAELNEAEQANILEAELWAFSRKREVLHVGFLNRLHKRMLGHVWRWAGQYRTTGKNIGVEAWRIGMDIAALLEECRYWIEAAVYDSSGATEVFENLGDLKFQVTLVTADGSDVRVLAEAQRTRFSNVEYIVPEGCGHFMPQEQPAAVASIALKALL